MGVLDPILGPILMGTVINVLFYGIMVLQCYLYFMWYKRDKLRVKAVVGTLFVLDTITCAFDIAMTYNYLVTNFGNIPGISVINLSLRPYPVTTGITAFIVQCFYGWRIHVLTDLLPLSILIYGLSTVQLLASIGTTIGGTIVDEFALLDRVKAVSLVWLIGSATTDLLITASLVWYLRKSRTGFSGTDDIITRLIRLIVQTNLITTAFAVAVIIAYLVSDSTIHIAFGVPLSKLYTNSLVSTLNARHGWAPLKANANLSTNQTASATQYSSSARGGLAGAGGKANVMGDVGLTSSKGGSKTVLGGYGASSANLGQVQSWHDPRGYGYAEGYNAGLSDAKGEAMDINMVALPPHHHQNAIRSQKSLPMMPMVSTHTMTMSDADVAVPIGAVGINLNYGEKARKVDDGDNQDGQSSSSGSRVSEDKHKFGRGNLGREDRV